MAYIFPTFLFCLAKAFVFVITQFKKPHLSRSRSPLRLLLLFAPLMLCDHHLIFEKAKAWNHLYNIMESFKHIYNNTKNKQRNEKCSDIWCLLKIKCMNCKGKMLDSSMRGSNFRSASMDLFLVQYPQKECNITQWNTHMIWTKICKTPLQTRIRTHTHTLLLIKTSIFRTIICM